MNGPLSDEHQRRMMRTGARRIIYRWGRSISKTIRCCSGRLADEDFDALFTTDKAVVFAFHGYPTLIHRLTYRRRNHDNIHVRGYVEEGATTTPFDRTVLNPMDRFQLALDVIKRVPRLRSIADGATQRFEEIMQRHKLYVCEHGEDLPEVRNWKWTAR